MRNPPKNRLHNSEHAITVINIVRVVVADHTITITIAVNITIISLKNITLTHYDHEVISASIITIIRTIITNTIMTTTMIIITQKFISIVVITMMWSY